MTDNIEESYHRIKNHINKTPLKSSSLLNSSLDGHQFFFKFESRQKTGSFKLRGALNKILKLKEENKLPSKIVAISSGNHAAAVAYAASLFKIPATIIMDKRCATLKIQATKSYGAEVILTNGRMEAIEQEKILENAGFLFIHPFDDDDVIAGQGTCCFEALTELEEKNIKIDSVFAPIGGGGLIAGTYLASQIFDKNIKTIAAEPKLANDASISLQTNKIFSFPDTVMDTIADGARTPFIAERTFHYLKKIDSLIEIEENDIVYWTQWIQHLLKINIELTSSLAMAASVQWLKKTKPTKKQNILIIISGGNNSFENMQKLWKTNYLTSIPSINDKA